MSDTVQKCCSICCKILKLCLTIFGRYTLKVLMFISYVKQISPGKKVNIEIIKLFQIIRIRLKNLHRLHMANESKWYKKMHALWIVVVKTILLKRYLLLKDSNSRNMQQLANGASQIKKEGTLTCWYLGCFKVFLGLVDQTEKLTSK